MNIIQYLLNIIQYLYQQNCWLLSFICRYVPLKQWSFDDSHSPKYQKFKFIADGYSAYPLAAMEFAKKFGNDFSFSVTRVIGLTNDDAVSKEYRPFKQMIERLNRTYKASYRQTNGFDNIDGANYDLAL